MFTKADFFPSPELLRMWILYFNMLNANFKVAHNFYNKFQTKNLNLKLIYYVPNETYVLVPFSWTNSMKETYDVHTCVYLYFVSSIF